MSYTTQLREQVRSREKINWPKYLIEDVETKKQLARLFKF